MKSRNMQEPSPLVKSMVARAVPDIRQPSTDRDEGHLLDVSRKLTGNDLMSINVDISSAPVPPRRYVAEVCSVSLHGGHLRLIFGQVALGEESALESALVIRLTPHSAHHFVEMLGGMKRPGLQVIAEKVGIPPIPLLAEVSRPAQTAHLAANMAALAVSGFESCLDFYQASAFSMHYVGKKDRLGVEPVVRIDLSTGLLISLARRATELVVELPAPPSVGEDS